MKKAIFIFVFVFLFVNLVSASVMYKYYEIDLNYNQGEITILDTRVELFQEEKTNLFGDNILSIWDNSGNLIESYLFDVPNKVRYDEVDENGTIIGGGESELEEINFTIYIPYYEDTYEIIIYGENLTEQSQIDVSMYSTTEEISLEEGDEGDDEIETEEDGIDKENKEGSKGLGDYWWILLIILVILVVVFVVSLNKKKPKQTTSYKKRKNF